MFENKNEKNVVEQALENENNIVSEVSVELAKLLQLIILSKLRII